MIIHSHSRYICFHDYKFMKLNRLKENFPSKNIKVKTKTKDATFFMGSTDTFLFRQLSLDFNVITTVPVAN